MGPGPEAVTSAVRSVGSLYLSPSILYLGRMNSTVSEKGQVTIPKTLRDRLGLRAGTVLEFHEEEGKLVATKVSGRDPVDAVYGILDLSGSTDELITRLRGELDAT